MLQADPDKFYHVFTAGKFPTYDWERSEWTEFEIKPDWVNSIAVCYDPAIHKAPLWIGHPWFSGAPAEGWIFSAQFDGKMLYNSFDYIDENFVKAVGDKKYQYVSCEFGRVMGINGDYQVALGATNLPRVSGQKPLEFEGKTFSMAQGHSVFCPINENFTKEITKDFSVSDKKYFFHNQNTNPMNEFLKKLALVFSIDLSMHNTDESVVSQISEKFSKLSSDNTALSGEVKNLKDERVKFALDLAIEQGKMKPEEKESFESLLQGNFEAARKVLMSRPSDPALQQNTLNTGGASADDPTKNKGDKFSNADGTKLTFEQFSEKLKADPAFAKQFSDEEISSLPGADKYYKR